MAPNMSVGMTFDLWYYSFTLTRLLHCLVQLEKMNTRKEDPTVAPTSFLWSAYSPNRYYYEVKLLSGPVWLSTILPSDRIAHKVINGCTMPEKGWCASFILQWGDWGWVGAATLLKQSSYDTPKRQHIAARYRFLKK